MFSLTLLPRPATFVFVCLLYLLSTIAARSCDYNEVLTYVLMYHDECMFYDTQR